MPPVAGSGYWSSPTTSCPMPAGAGTRSGTLKSPAHRSCAAFPAPSPTPSSRIPTSVGRSASCWSRTASDSFPTSADGVVLTTMPSVRAPILSPGSMPRARRTKGTAGVPPCVIARRWPSTAGWSTTRSSKAGCRRRFRSTPGGSTTGSSGKAWSRGTRSRSCSPSGPTRSFGRRGEDSGGHAFRRECLGMRRSLPRVAHARGRLAHPALVGRRSSVRLRRRPVSHAESPGPVAFRRAATPPRNGPTPTVPAGRVFVPMHYDGVNRLTAASFDPHSRQPSYKHCAVRLAPPNDRKAPRPGKPSGPGEFPGRDSRDPGAHQSVGL
ncbi:MAG: hypothetical protein DVB31_13135 [Verrucomicrobia bacterium]|nr:MAG: hypothetical protein DVB31_13135 [Verrucomicrobiota bacterium]